jgi:hypothetical protein
MTLHGFVADPAARRLRLATITIAGAVGLGGCYLYRTPTAPQPIVAAAALSRDVAIEDLDTLVAIVAEVHPSPTPWLQPLRDSLARVWPETVSRARLARDLGRVLAGLGDGHTSLWFDRLEESDGLTRGATTWSFSVRRSAEGIIIGRVVGRDTAVLRPGDRLDAVNGLKIHSLVHELGRAVSAELPAWRDREVLASLGSRLWVDGIRPPAELHVTGVDGRPRTIQVVGATRQELQRESTARAQGDPLTVRSFRDSLLVLDFDRMWGDRSAFATRLDSIFAAAARSGVRAVVVDLRRNTGGNSEWGIQLLSYVTNTRLSQGVRKEWKGSRRYRRFFKSRVSPLLRYTIPFSLVDAPMGGLFSGADGTTAVMPFTPARPAANARRLERPLCLLIGPGTFSSAMMLANTARRSGVATLIGEPTGEPPNSHGEVMAFHLRRSGLGGQVSSARFVLDEDPAGDRRGVLPHIAVVPTREDIAAGRDPVMERAAACGRM